MVNLMDGKCGEIRGAGVVVRSEAGMADAETVQSPVSGLNRRIIPVDKSLLESLEELSISSKQYGETHETAVVAQSAAGIADAETVQSPASGSNRRIMPVDNEALSESESESESLNGPGLSSRQYGEIHETAVVAQSAAGVADAETIQSPASGSNRRIMPVDNESLLESLEEPRTSSKSLCDRICGLWLIRKIINLFKKVFVCSRKNIDPGSEEAARSGGGVAVKAETTREIPAHEFRLVKCVSKSELLLGTVRDLCEMVENKDPASDNWTDISVLFEQLKTSLDQLESDISYLKSCQSEFDNVKDRERIEQLAERKEEIDMCSGWIEFHIKDSRADGYYNCNMRYYDTTLTHLYNVAKKALSGQKSQLGDLDTLYQTARSSAEKKIKDGHACDAINDVAEFKTGMLGLVDSVNCRNKYQREFFRSLPVLVPGPDISSAH